MANYLATADVGQWEFKTGRTPGGIPETVAIDPSLKADQRPDGWTSSTTPPPRPRTCGTRPSAPTRSLDRRDRRQRDVQRPVDRLLAGDPDPAAVLRGAQHRHDRPRAGAPVVRRRRLGGQTGTTSGSTRASRRSREYLWGEHTGVRTRPPGVPQRLRPAGDQPFWKIVVADPQRDTMFAAAVYRRGGMTLQALREKIGDDPFFQILRTWVAEHEYGNAHHRSSSSPWPSRSPART